MVSFKQLIRLVLIFGVINFVLWGAQELYHKEDTQRIKIIEAQLEADQRDIDSLEAKIALEEAEIERKQKQLDRYKYLGSIDEYNNGVNDFNYLLAVYKSDLNAYNNKLTSYNQKVDEVNTLIKKSGSRWYLIPIPLPGKTTKSELPVK